MAPSVAIFLLLLSTFSFGFARRLGECDIARELRNHGLSRSSLADWVCLVLSESSGDTRAINHHNSDGSKDWGLFQINDRYWCKHGQRGGGCNIECQQLMSDDITVSVNCAQIIYREQGFPAWVGWKNKCRGGRAPSVDHCFGPSAGSRSGGECFSSW